MKDWQLHKAQASILYTLRHKSSAAFSALMRPTGMTSDAFKFHVRKLVKFGFIQKLPDGTYALTPAGKEFANDLDQELPAMQHRPKLSVLVVAAKADADGRTLYLMQERLRHPYFGFHGMISGPVRWGESAIDAAKRELRRQTGLKASMSVVAACRQRDTAEGSKELLEDKLFLIIEAAKVRGELMQSWDGGRNAWMTLEKYGEKLRRFPLTEAALDALRHRTAYFEIDTFYKESDY